MRSLYTAVDALLDTIDFGSLWRGFTRFPFALYNSSTAYLRDKTINADNRFVGNTSIEFEGRYIAIWKVEDPRREDPELLAAGIVHEMFHAFQRQQEEARFPSDLIILDYPDDIGNHQRRLAEHQLLAEAYQTKDRDHKKALLEEFMAARKYRAGHLGDMISQEYCIETIEGMADYIGTCALRRLSPVKFNTGMLGYIGRLTHIGQEFFDIRRMLYFSGTVFCTLLYELGMPLYHSITGETRSLFELVSADIPAREPVYEVSDGLTAAFNEYVNSKKTTFLTFKQTHKEITQGDFILCAYDPMNMIKLGSDMLCTHFVMLLPQDAPEPFFLKGPILLTLKDGSINQVSSYIR